MAVRDALVARNRAGGLRGYRLELVSLDSWNDPPTARRRAAELVADPLVRAVLVGDPAAAIELHGAPVALASAFTAGDASAAIERLLAAIEAGELTVK